MDAPEAQSVLVRSTHTHTHTHFSLGNSVSRADCAFNISLSNVPQFSNSKDGILQQSPIELILTLSLGFREERMCEGKKKRGYNA